MIAINLSATLTLPTAPEAATPVIATALVGNQGDGVTVALTGVSSSGQAGDVVFNKIAALTGVSASGAVGTVSVGERLVAITGSQAMGRVGSPGVFYWSLIDDNQSANWTLVPTE